MREVGRKIDPLGKEITRYSDPLEIYTSQERLEAEAKAKFGSSSVVSGQETEAANERRRLLAEQMGRQRAARRGGYRALLSQQRLSPETGLQTTLGVA